MRARRIEEFFDGFEFVGLSDTLYYTVCDDRYLKRFGIPKGSKAMFPASCRGHAPDLRSNLRGIVCCDDTKFGYPIVVDTGASYPVSKAEAPSEIPPVPIRFHAFPDPYVALAVFDGAPY